VKMTEAPCKIEGLECTAIEIDLLGKKTMKAAAMLLRDPNKHDGVNAGRYNKDRGWSLNVVEKLDALIAAVERDLLLDIFDVDDTRMADLDAEGNSETEDKKDKSNDLSFPTFGKGQP